MSITPPSPLPFHVSRPISRPVDPQWTCQQSGDCCSIPDEVVMTPEEARAISTTLLLKGYGNILTEWRDAGDGKVGLKAKPCPFYVFKTCLVYESRPYNCRRFGCMRPDPKTEPFELTQTAIGCANLEDRVRTSRPARRLAVTMQRKAQRWAYAHGWAPGRV